MKTSQQVTEFVWFIIDERMTTPQRQQLYNYYQRNEKRSRRLVRRWEKRRQTSKASQSC